MADDSLKIQWYPGHMTKTRRRMEEDLRFVDLVCEVIDARIPVTSRNPDLAALIGEKPRLIIFNRSGQADPEQNKRWMSFFRERSVPALETDCRTGFGISAFPAAARRVLKEKLQRYAEKGQAGRPVRAMVAGVPNVGKSAFINRVAKRKTAKVEDRPGVTRGRQWVGVDAGLELLDTPGILWPKFGDETVGLHLAFTGAVRDDVLDLEGVAAKLMELLSRRYPDALRARYKVEPEAETPGWALLEEAAKKRGFLVSGGEADLDRMARTLLDEFRSGKLGRFTLEYPE
jgi:ribosome biogenesis GTPase A